MKWLRPICMVALAVACVLPFTDVGSAFAGGRPHRTRLTAGTDRAGNDFEELTFKGGKRFKHNASQHFSMEEYLYGPGDQSRLWHRDFIQRDNDRSSFRAGARARAAYFDDGYGVYYSDSCDDGPVFEDERIFESRRTRRY